MTQIQRVNLECWEQKQHDAVKQHLSKFWIEHFNFVIIFIDIPVYHIYVINMNDYQKQNQNDYKSFEYFSLNFNELLFILFNLTTNLLQSSKVPVNDFALVQQC